MEAANIHNCPEREKFVIIIFYEMHVREDLVYDKHSGIRIKDLLVDFKLALSLNIWLEENAENLSTSLVLHFIKLEAISTAFCACGDVTLKSPEYMTFSKAFSTI